jgi:SAM-dependent methyltransferase
LARAKSSQFWTPLEVARRAALTFAAFGARRVLDVGCGPGKFCIAAALACPELEFHGIEQRPELVRTAKDLALRFQVRNVTFSEGDALLAPWENFDGFYFFNPFSESLFGVDERFDDHADFSKQRFAQALLSTEALLTRARLGTVLITYHGLTGPIPASYHLVTDDRAGSDRIHTWVQRHQTPCPWAWLETGGSIQRVWQAEIRSALASLIGDADVEAAAAAPSRALRMAGSCATARRLHWFGGRR